MAGLSNFSKAIESTFLEQIMEYLNTNSLLSDHQFCFRPNMSTARELLNSADLIPASLVGYEAFDSVYLDLSKAFDKWLISEHISALYNTGVRGKALQ